MADNDQLTPEQMMERISQLSKENEQLKGENTTLKETNEKNSTSLQKAREINSELLLRIGVPSKEPSKEPEKEDSFDDLMQETLDAVVEKITGKKKE